MSNDQYISDLLDANTPEETFFQIMAMKSKFNNLVTVNNPDMVAQNCKTFAFFFDNRHPFTGHPHLMDIDKCKEVINMNKFYFARKFDASIDEEALNYLDGLIEI